MRIGAFLKVMGIVTLMAVLYINLQMKIYTYAYKGKANEQKIDKLSEANAQVHNDILRLKSSDNLGQKLLVQDKTYQFASRQRVVEVEAGSSRAIASLAAGNVDTKPGILSRIVLAFAPAHN
ncbi:MAG: hypothetical protein HQL19_02390 [Candidatus Omnitrophica bacterium]|nr:hypothetical protein [Candidatus Omnitrophota bacterium]